MTKLKYIAVLVILILPLQAAFGADVYEQLKKFNQVLGTAQKNYVEDVDVDKLGEAAIIGMLKELDPHSVYISAEKMKDVKEDFRGNFEGIGVQYSMIDDTLNIISALSGGPSQEVGIMAGDKIVKVDGESIIAADNSTIQDKLRGPGGTKVVCTIKREGTADLIDFEIIRDKIPLYSVDASFLIDGTDIGYISVNRFMATTHIEMMDSLEVLSNKGMKKLILDLRGNPGGYLSEAFKMADEFIPGGHKIVYTKGRLPQFDNEYHSTDGGKYEKVPLIVLIDYGSASASEIVSGAVQDLDRGLVIGETSFGKGLVQNEYPLSDGSAFRLTISRYYTPSGRCIQRPYDDKDAYVKMQDRLDLKEGDNLDHKLEELAAEGTDLPIHHTIGGRKVVGGGGIMPDYIVKYDTLTKLSIQIRMKNVFNSFAMNFLSKHGDEFKAKYEKDFKAFLRDFDIEGEYLEEFKELVKSKDIEWDEEQFNTDKEYLFRAAKSRIANAVWDNNEAAQVFLPVYPQIQKAIELFPAAEKFAKLN